MIRNDEPYPTSSTLSNFIQQNSKKLMKRVVFIINPHSGTDRVKAMQDAIADGMDAQRYAWEIRYTERAGHGVDLAREAAGEGAAIVVAVGGDGSVADAAAGLIGTNAALGIIPKGSGNGMARNMGMSLIVDKAIATINAGKRMRIDVGYANEQLFLSNAGVGFDTLVSKEFAASTRRGLGVYSWLVTKHLWLYKEWEWDIEIDGKPIQEKAFLVNVANGKQFGYNFTIAPDASVTDGVLDLVIIRKFPKLLGGMLAIQALWGRITDNPYVEHHQAKAVRISHPKLRWMQTDGDAKPCDGSVSFRVVPAALELIVP
jgi:diacylglycerol kinase (ATP)